MARISSRSLTDTCEPISVASLVGGLAHLPVQLRHALGAGGDLDEPLPRHALLGAGVAGRGGVELLARQAEGGAAGERLERAQARLVVGLLGPEALNLLGED